MRAKKGNFKICTDEGWKEYEGSHCACYPFTIHRTKGQRFWTVSHMATGYAVRKNVPKWQDAKKMVMDLKPYSVFLMPCLETWNKALARMRENNLKQYDKMMKIVSKHG
jgi:hypothetical protein